MYSSVVQAVKKIDAAVLQVTQEGRMGKKTKRQKHMQRVMDDSQTAFPQLLPVSPLLLSKVFVYDMLYYLTKFRDTHKKKPVQNRTKLVFSQHQLYEHLNITTELLLLGVVKKKLRNQFCLVLEVGSKNTSSLKKTK